MLQPLKPVDHAALRANQAAIITLLALAFILNLPWLAGVVGLLMLGGSLLFRRPGFFWFYRYVLREFGIARPDILQDHPEPHLFAQGLGGVFVLAGTAALLVGWQGLGWALAWIVIALASLNLFGGFCVGCAMYYWLHRLGLPGFTQSPLEGVVPGMRPKDGSRAGVDLGAKH